jgi:uncharacterized protein YndB with AHSA1/START domain
VSVFKYHSERRAGRSVSVCKEIAAPGEAVFDLLADPSKHPLLDGSGTVLASRGATARLSLGSRFAMSMRQGLPYRVTNTVVEFEEGRRIAWRHAGAHVWRWQLEPLEDDRTRVTETFDWSTALAPGVVELLGYPQRNERSMVATLDRLERLLTEQPRADGVASRTESVAPGGGDGARPSAEDAPAGTTGPGA